MGGKSIGVGAATLPRRKAEIEALKTTSAWRELERLGVLRDQGWYGTARWGVEITVTDRLDFVINAYEDKLRPGTFVDGRNAQDRLRSRPITGEGLSMLVADLRERIVHHAPTHLSQRRLGRPRKGSAPMTSTERGREMRRRRAEEKGWQVIQLRVHPDDTAALRTFAAQLDLRRAR
jgi:hypothetical protein